MKRKYIEALLEIEHKASGPALEAAIEHLVTGQPQALLAEQFGVKQPSISKRVSRIKELDRWAVEAVRIKNSEGE